MEISGGEKINCIPAMKCIDTCLFEEMELLSEYPYLIKDSVTKKTLEAELKILPTKFTLESTE